MHRPVVLIMTATIKPPSNCPDLMRSCSFVRLNDYCKALKFYLRIPSNYINRIVFVENSGYDLSSLRKIEEDICHDKNLEFIPFPNGNDYPPEYGKGYGEMTMINYALDNSTIITEDDIIWKATGRLVLYNIKDLIEKAPHPYDVYCDLHNSFRVLSLENFFDPRFYSFTKKGYNKYFRIDLEKLKYSHIEYLYFDILKNGLMTGKINPRFKKQPIIMGFSASTDSNYFSLKKKIQRQLQQIMRYIAPRIWF